MSRYIFTNAIKSITRSKGRNVLIGVVVTIIAVASCISLSIKNAAKDIVSSYQESTEITAMISVDRAAMREAAQSQGLDMRRFAAAFTSPDPEKMKQYGESEYLEDFTYTLTGTLNAEAMVPLSNEESTQEGQNQTGGFRPGNPGGSFIPGATVSRGDFTVIGYSGYRAMRGFIDGTMQMAQGEIFPEDTAEPLCIISEELAAENELAVGDTVLFVNPANESETKAFRIIGIFADQGAQDEYAMNWFSYSANQILTSDEALTAATSGWTDYQTQFAAVFYLKNAEVIDPFEAQLREKGLDSIYMLTTNLDQSAESLKPLLNLDRFAGVFLILVLLVGGAILFILNLINVRERKYEIGVLRAIGMKKGKVAMQFMTELLVVSMIGIMLGSVVGAVVSVPAANQMLRSEIEAVQSDQAAITRNFGGGQGMPQIDRNRDFMGGAFNPGGNVTYLSQIDAVINARVLLWLIGIGILLSVASSILSVVAISRYEPLKILSERS